MTPRAIVALLIRARPTAALDELSEHFALHPARNDSRFQTLACNLSAYTDGRGFRCPFPLDLWWADPFDRKVYRTLRRTRTGEILSYGELARRIGYPRNARRVGLSLGRNRILIAIPCHRVIRSDRSPGGFSAGTELKRLLLAIEKPLKENSSKGAGEE